MISRVISGSLIVGVIVYFIAILIAVSIEQAAFMNLKKKAAAGDQQAKAELDEIQRKDREEREKEDSRLAALPKCPMCGKPIEPVFVNQFWGSRFQHATYAPDCKWSDDKLHNPYIPS